MTRCPLMIAVWLLAITVRTGLADAQTVPVEKAARTEPSVEGRTIAEWRQTIRVLEPKSPATAEFIPGLIALCGDASVPVVLREQAAMTLGRIGRKAEAAVPALAARLDDPQTARWAAKALSLFGEVAAPATPTLIALSKDAAHSLSTRSAAMEALGRIGGAHALAIPALIHLSQPSDLDRASPPDDVERVEYRLLREAAIDSLAFAGSAASPSVPLMIRLSRDPAWTTRYRAVLVLSSIGPAADIATDALAERVIFDEEAEVRMMASKALADIGPVGEAALRHLLKDEETAVRRLAAQALVAVSNPEDSTRSALRRTAMKDAAIDVRLTAIEALLAMEDDLLPLLSVLTESLTLTDRQSRMHAVRLLVSIGPSAESAIPRLEQLADDDRPHVRQAARKALVGIRGERKAREKSALPPG